MSKESGWGASGLEAGWLIDELMNKWMDGFGYIISYHIISREERKYLLWNLLYYRVRDV